MEGKLDAGSPSWGGTTLIATTGRAMQKHHYHKLGILTRDGTTDGNNKGQLCSVEEEFYPCQKI